MAVLMLLLQRGKIFKSCLLAQKKTGQVLRNIRTLANRIYNTTNSYLKQKTSFGTAQDRDIQFPEVN